MTPVPWKRSVRRYIGRTSKTRPQRKRARRRWSSDVRPHRLGLGCRDWRVASQNRRRPGTRRRRSPRLAQATLQHSARQPRARGGWPQRAGDESRSVGFSDSQATQRRLQHAHRNGGRVAHVAGPRGLKSLPVSGPGFLRMATLRQATNPVLHSPSRWATDAFGRVGSRNEPGRMAARTSPLC